MLNLPVMKKQSSTADKENEHKKEDSACKIRVTCSTTENELETNTTCKNGKFIII